MSNFETFHYPFRSYDMTDMSDETRDLLNVRDVNLESYLNGFGDIFVQESNVRYGSAVRTLPAVGSSVTVTFANVPTYQDSYINIAAAFDATLSTFQTTVISNGDYAANPATLEGASEGATRIRVWHVGGGNEGATFRVNFISFAIR